ncbi:MAG: tetratricopeptide repeat protein [Elusimicrobiales bacterium]
MKNLKARALIVVLTFAAAAMSPALKADFMRNWDDGAYVVSNPAITRLSPQSAGEMFSSLHRGLYKPLTMLSFAVEYRLAGLKPWLYHADNLALHLANCALVLFIGIELGMGLAGAFWLALFFGVHPMNVESVAWISERKELLHGLFFLASIYTYLRWRGGGGRAFIIWSPVLFATGLLAKPQGVALPIALMLMDWAAFRKITLRDKLAHFAAAAFFGGLALFTTSADRVLAVAAGQAASGPWRGLCIAAHSLCGYLLRFALPVKLSAIYPAPGTPLPLEFVLAPFAAVLAAGALIYAARRDRRALAGLAFFLAAILPLVSMLPPGPSVAFDHYAYLPYLGLGCAAIAGADNLLKLRPQWKKGMFAAAGAAALVFAVLSLARARTWQSAESMWSDVIAKNPRFVPGYLTRGTVYQSGGFFDKALADFSAAAEIDPDYVFSYGKRASLYCAAGNYAAAIADFDKALALDPAYGYCWRWRGWARMKLGRYGGAASDFSRAAELDPSGWEPYSLRADAELSLGRPELALADYSKSIELNPNQPLAWHNRAAIYSAMGRFQDAIAGDSEAIRLAPGFAQAYANRGIACGRSGEHRRALEDFDKALSLEPGNAYALEGRRAALGNLHGQK